MKNILEYDKDKLTKEEEFFLTCTINQANDSGFVVKLVNERGVKYGDGSTVNGYLEVEDANRTLAVATKKSKSKWMKILIHESCHMDQYLEDALAWRDTVVKEHYEAPTLIFTWTDHVVELNKKQLREYILKVVELELDCERRSVAKMMAYNLPYSTAEYAQRANAYVYFYWVLAHTRKWYKIGREPYNIKEVWQQMPTHFANDYSRLPKGMLSLYKEHCYR